MKAHTGLLRLGGLLIALPLLVWSWALRPTAELHRSVREQAARIEAAERSGAAVLGAQSAAPQLGPQGRNEDEREAFENVSEREGGLGGRALLSPQVPAAPQLGPQGRNEDEAIRSGTVLHRLAPTLERCSATAERYTPYRLGVEAGAECWAAELLLSGGFHALTRLLEEIEHGCTSERIVSVGYTAALDPQSRKKTLQMTVVFQQITQNTMP